MSDESYTIDKISIADFVKNKHKYRLPRYQRRQVWDDNRNFELAISVFQDYPIGTIIIHNRGVNDNLLLDGRQRRAALVDIVTNPTVLYEWAKKIIGFKDDTGTPDVRKRFKAKVNAYSQEGNNYGVEENKNNDNKKDSTKEKAKKEVLDDDDDDDEFFNTRQGKRLKILLELILLVQDAVRSEGDEEKRWEDIFDFTESGVIMKPYCNSSTKVDPFGLYMFLGEYIEMCQFPNAKKFIEFCRGKTLIDEKNKSFDEEVSARWPLIKKSIDIITSARDIYECANIGLVTLKNDISYFDALNIFSRVNSNGMPLSQEELLSANPYWNQKVTLDVSNERDDKKQNELRRTKARILDLRQRFQTIQDGQELEIVRWDLGATLVPRLDDNLVLKQNTEDEDNGKFFGFRLLSSLYKGGISKKYLALLEKDESIFSDGDMYSLVCDLKNVLEIVRKSKFFNRYLKGGRPLMDILGVAPALEFITILYKSWETKGHPTMRKNHRSPKIEELQREAFILFDKLAYERASGVWRGTSDSTMARHISNWEERVGIKGDIKLHSLEEWKSCIASSADPSLMKWAEKLAVLYYIEALRNGFKNNANEDVYEIDHIIPQSEFRKSSTDEADKNKKDNLGNLALLPKYWNDSKDNKSLTALGVSIEDLPGNSGTSLEEVVESAIGIKKEEFKEYSGLSHIDKLIEYRTNNVLIEALKIRDKILEKPRL